MFATPIIPYREALFADPRPQPELLTAVRRWIEAKTAYGKLDKKAVRAPYWAGQDRMVR